MNKKMETMHLGVVSETAEGMYVSGAKMSSDTGADYG
ncbi:hypothetical protein ACT7DH_14135 [Bacillus pacificus]